MAAGGAIAIVVPTLLMWGNMSRRICFLALLSLLKSTVAVVAPGTAEASPSAANETQPQSSRALRSRRKRLRSLTLLKARVGDALGRLAAFRVTGRELVRSVGVLALSTTLLAAQVVGAQERWSKPPTLELNQATVRHSGKLKPPTLDLNELKPPKLDVQKYKRLRDAELRKLKPPTLDVQKYQRQRDAELRKLKPPTLDLKTYQVPTLYPSQQGQRNRYGTTQTYGTPKYSVTKLPAKSFKVQTPPTLNSAASRAKKDGFRVAFPLGGTGWYVSRGFGRQLHPVHHDLRMHDGIDLNKKGWADSGATVRSAIDGVVTASGRASGYGFRVIVTRSDGVSTLYGHLQHKGRLAVGTQVKAGAAIGKVGNTGTSTGPHLHFEWRIHGKSVSPLSVPEFAQSARGFIR